MSVEALNKMSATPEFILAKARELDPQLVVVTMLTKTGETVTLMSNMSGQDLTFLSMTLQAQVLDFLRGNR